MLHRFLGIGLVLLAGVAVGLRQMGLAPTLNAGSGAGSIIVYVFAGASLVMVFAAFFVLKPRAPERRSGQSAAEYWTTPEVGARILPVWFLSEGAGVTAAIGYMLTGHVISLLVVGVAVAAFWLLGPDTFAKP